MAICSSCKKGTILPILTSSPFMIIKEQATQNELDSGIVFVLNGLNKWGKDERTSSYYLNREMGLVGLQLGTFSRANFYMHTLPKKGRSKEEKAVQLGCTDFSIAEVINIAKYKKILMLMGAETIKTFTGYNASDVYGLVCKSDLLPDVPVIIPAPNPDKLMNSPIGEMRNALKVLAEQVKIYKEYSKL